MAATDGASASWMGTRELWFISTISSRTLLARSRPPTIRGSDTLVQRCDGPRLIEWRMLVHDFKELTAEVVRRPPPRLP